MPCNLLMYFAFKPYLNQSNKYRPLGVISGNIYCNQNKFNPITIVSPLPRSTHIRVYPTFVDKHKDIKCGAIPDF
jgi:hypothetical protein